MSEFTEFEEEQIILLALDSPEFFFRIIKFMDHEYFENEAHQYIMASYIEYYNEYDETPTREALKNIIYKELRQDDDLADPVISILDKELDVRNSKYIRDTVVKWAKIKQLSLLYSEETMDNIKEGDASAVEDIIEKAMSITDVVIKPFRFFEDVDGLFVDDVHSYFTTGFTRLNNLIHDGNGPAKREVFIWVAPTGVGKSIMLVNTALDNVMLGKKVLHITLENSNEVTGHRYLGVFTNIAIAQRKDKEDKMKEKINKIKISSSGDLYIMYFPTDSISVREIDLAISELKRHYGFVPEVIVIDYLECLLSKNQHKNKDEYDRQKSISSEIRALAATTDTIIFTASQTNRSGSSAADNNQNINLDKLAESYGKAMPADYIVSINQTTKDYNNDDDKNSLIGRVKFYVAKNRNGPKHKVINAKINYATMKTVQDEVDSD